MKLYVMPSGTPFCFLILCLVESFGEYADIWEVSNSESANQNISIFPILTFS
jgi:hypothetical protein